MMAHGVRSACPCKPLTTKTTTFLIQTTSSISIKEQIMVNSRKHLEDHNCGMAY